LLYLTIQIDNNMKITRKSPFSGDVNTMDLDVTQEQLDLWNSGVSIQNALSNLSPENREFIMTGITPEEWDESFGKFCNL